jgi:hypothetical protein
MNMKSEKNVTHPLPSANGANTQSFPSYGTEHGKPKSTVPEERTTKAEANRRNALKSTGPKSARGKQKSRLNSLKDGLFSKEVVVTAAGERVENFKRFEAWVWDSAQPDGAIEEILTNDVVANWWGRQRIRRCQSAELENRLENLKAHDLYLRSDEIEPLTIRFRLALEQYQAAPNSLPSKDFNEIITELENVRSQLASTSLGLEFLIKKVKGVKEEAESNGQISVASEVTLRACAGFTNHLAVCCRGMNWVIKKESAKAAERAQSRQRGGIGQTKEVEPEKAKRVQSGGQREAGESSKAELKFVLVSTIEDVERELELRKQVLEAIEESYDKTRVAAAVLPADSTYDRFARAETAYDRRLYRALALLTMKQARETSF